MIKHALMLTFLWAGAANGQSVLIGAKGAASLLDTAPYNGSSESKRYNVGPSVEVRLPRGFAIEADALYQRVGQSQYFNIGGATIILPDGSTGPVAGVYFNRMRGNSWQFPILAKRYFRVRTSAWQPFVSLGPSIRRVTYQYEANEVLIDNNGQHNYTLHSNPAANVSVGATAAVGARLHKGRFNIMPEFRFTRWAQNNGSILARNQANAFLGLSF